MPRLDSSAIRRVTYNPKTQKMNVQFVGTGKQYTYVGVPEDVYDDFVNSSSAGKFFNDNIKDDYIAVPSEFVGSVRFDSPDDEDFYEERNMSGKELNEGKKEIKTSAELVDIFKKQKAYTELLRRQEALSRIKERGRLPRDPDMIDPTFRKTVPQSFSRITGEDMSVSKDVLKENPAILVPAAPLMPTPQLILTILTGLGLGSIVNRMKRGTLTPADEDALRKRGIDPSGPPGQRPNRTPGFKPPSGPLRTLYTLILGGGLYALVCRVVSRLMSDEDPNLIKKVCFSITTVIKAILLILLLSGLGFVTVKGLIPRIKRALENRETINNIKVALAENDQEMARAILMDAIEDQGINLSMVKRNFSEREFSRLMDEIK